jgi:hypothetical protein
MKKEDRVTIPRERQSIRAHFCLQQRVSAGVKTSGVHVRMRNEQRERGRLGRHRATCGTVCGRALHLCWRCWTGAASKSKKCFVAPYKSCCKESYCFVLAWLYKEILLFHIYRGTLLVPLDLMCNALRMLLFHFKLAWSYITNNALHTHIFY